MGIVFDRRNNKLKLDGGKELDSFCILVDDDVLLSYGDYNSIRDKYELLYRAFKSKGVDTSSMFVMNVSSMIELKDCPFVLDYLTSSTASGRVKEFINRFINGEVYSWLNNLKEAV